MKKKILENFIRKYSIGDQISTVLWKIKDDVLNTSIITKNKNVRGFVSVLDEECNNEFKTKLGDDLGVGIIDTSILRKMISVLNEEVSVKLNVEGDVVYNMTFFDDEKNEVTYSACEPSVIPTVSGLKVTPNFDFEFEIDDAFIDKFIKSYNSIKSDDELTFTIMLNGKKSKIVLGFSEKINKNKISMPITASEFDDNVDKKITFFAKNFVEILRANRGFDEISFKLSSDGLINISFSDGEVNSEYYIVYTEQK